jgi:hypothetical protein
VNRVESNANAFATVNFSPAIFNGLMFNSLMCNDLICSGLMFSAARVASTIEPSFVNPTQITKNRRHRGNSKGSMQRAMQESWELSVPECSLIQSKHWVS